MQQYAIQMVLLEPTMGIALVFGTEAEQAFADKQVADRHATAVEVWKVAAYFDFRPLQLGSGHPPFSEAMDMYVDLLVAEIPLKRVLSGPAAPFRWPRRKVGGFRASHRGGVSRQSAVYPFVWPVNCSASREKPV